MFNFDLGLPEKGTKGHYELAQLLARQAQSQPMTSYAQPFAQLASMLALGSSSSAYEGAEQERLEAEKAQKQAALAALGQRFGQEDLDQIAPLWGDDMSGGLKDLLSMEHGVEDQDMQREKHRRSGERHDFDMKRKKTKGAGGGKKRRGSWKIEMMAGPDGNVIPVRVNATTGEVEPLEGGFRPLDDNGLPFTPVDPVTPPTAEADEGGSIFNPSTWFKDDQTQAGPTAPASNDLAETLAGGTTAPIPPAPPAPPAPMAAPDPAAPVAPVAPASPVAPVAPSNTPTAMPTMMHIEALKANPQMAAEFDAKFGPGEARKFLEGA